MKVTMTANSKHIVSLEEAPAARRIIEEMKEDESSAADYIRMAVNAACGGCVTIVEVFKATAEISKNCRASDCYGENTGMLDVWIDANVQTFDSFLIIGAYLSDIWQLCPDNYSEISRHFYIRKFTECNPA